MQLIFAPMAGHAHLTDDLFDNHTVRFPAMFARRKVQQAQKTAVSPVRTKEGCLSRRKGTLGFHVEDQPCVWDQDFVCLCRRNSR